MARTWPVTRPKRALLAAFDALARPVASLLPQASPPAHGEVDRILILELWHMGDVVLATSVLQSIRVMFPEARVTLLAKEHARELLANSGLVDEIEMFDFPWTASSGKYRLGRYDRRAIGTLVGKLRSHRYDLSIDARMDVRSNALTRAIGARRRVGYDFGGGAFLLSDALPPPPADQHKVDDWMALLDPLGDIAVAPAPPSSDPLLSVTAEEAEEARRLLRSYDVDDGDIVVGVHPGGSHAGKRWAEDYFGEVGQALVNRHGVKVVVFVDPDGIGAEIQPGVDTIHVRTSIREMMALFRCCDTVICNDSGPMHVAAALGVPVVAVFTAGNPQAYGPRGLDHRVVGEGAPHGVSSAVAVEDVIEAGEAIIAGRSARPMAADGEPA